MDCEPYQGAGPRKGFLRGHLAAKALRIGGFVRESQVSDHSNKSMVAANGFAGARGRSIKCFLKVHAFDGYIDSL